MTKPETKRDKATAKKRQHILNAAMTCFIERGYHQTGVREIAKQAEISLGNLYNHFPGKPDVLAEIAKQEQSDLEPFLSLLRKDRPADRVLEGFIEAYLDYLASPEIAVLTLEITCEAIRNQEIADLFNGSRDALAQAMMELLRRGIRDGTLRAVPDVEEAAHIVLEAIESSSYRIALSGAPRQKVLASLKNLLANAFSRPESK
ncbi:MAG: TetR/AcrR family transcriptional regulator [Mangrovicoccus sp.]